MVSFIVQKIFSLMEFHLFIFAFVAIVFKSDTKKSLPRLMSISLLLPFFSRSFMVSDLVFKSLIHSEPVLRVV